MVTPRGQCAIKLVPGRGSRWADQAGWGVGEAILLHSYSKSRRVSVRSRRAAWRNLLQGVEFCLPKSTSPRPSEWDRVGSLQTRGQKVKVMLASLQEETRAPGETRREEGQETTEQQGKERRGAPRPPKARQRRKGWSPEPSEEAWSCRGLDFRLPASNAENSSHWFGVLRYRTTSVFRARRMEAGKGQGPAKTNG